MLDMSDVDRVTWLCQQLDPAQLLNQEPLPLSQSVLLSLMQQLGSQLGKVGCPYARPLRKQLHAGRRGTIRMRWGKGLPSGNSFGLHVAVSCIIKCRVCYGVDVLHTADLLMHKLLQGISLMSCCCAAGHAGEAAVDQGGGAKSGPQRRHAGASHARDPADAVS